MGLRAESLFNCWSVTRFLVLEIHFTNDQGCLPLLVRGDISSFHQRWQGGRYKVKNLFPDRTFFPR